MGPMNNHPALVAYLSAVEVRNLPALVSQAAADVTLILPQGQLVADKTDFETFHREWFADPDWRLQADLVRGHTSETAASFVLHVTYLDKDRAGNPVSYPYYLCLSFVRAGGPWSLVLDQNTPIIP